MPDGNMETSQLVSDLDIRLVVKILVFQELMKHGIVSWDSFTDTCHYITSLTSHFYHLS